MQQQELIRAHCSGGRISVSADAAGNKRVTIRVIGSGERIFMANAITEVRLGLGFWYFVGFFRTLTFNVPGAAPIRLRNLRKSKAKAIKSLLGF